MNGVLVIARLEWDDVPLRLFSDIETARRYCFETMEYRMVDGENGVSDSAFEEISRMADVVFEIEATAFIGISLATIENGVFTVCKHLEAAGVVG